LTNQADARLVHGRSEWQHTRCRLNSFDTLAERVQHQEALAENKRAQRDSDEHTSRQFYMRSASSAG